MLLNTTRFGEIEVADEHVLTFTQPVIGFQDYRRFVVLDGPDNSRVWWLQSTDSGDLAFLLMNPKDVIPDYRVQLGAHELAELAVTKADELEVYTLVVVPADPNEVRTNLRAPIVVNRKQRLGKQTVLEKQDYPIQYFLAQARAAAPQETGHARTDT